MIEQPLESSQVLNDINLAFAKRRELIASKDINVFRVFHGYSEGMPGVEIDVFDHVAVVRCRNKHKDSFALFSKAIESLDFIDTLIVKSSDDEVAYLKGERLASPVVVNEYGLKMHIECWQPRNPGLFIDARPIRRWIRDHSEGKRILNLFSFTGSLGITAMLGGAKAVTHVDSQKRMLERCKSNHELNQVKVDHRDLVRLNIYKHITKISKGPRYGGIVVDPPPYEPNGQKPSSIGYGSTALAPYCLPMLEDKGWMLCFFHYGNGVDEDEKKILDSSNGQLSIVWRGTSGEDYPETDMTKKLRVTAFKKSVQS